MIKSVFLFYRLERLVRMAEKVHRECKYTEESLADLERRIQDTEQRGSTLHPFEAKRNCEAMERSLRNLEETLKAMFRDVQTLQDNRFPQAQQLDNRWVHGGGGFDNDDNDVEDE